MMSSFAAELASLAATHTHSARGLLLDKLIDLYGPRAADTTPKERALFAEIILSVIRQATQQVRADAAKRLSEEDWTDPGVAMVLALDVIEVARPILARSAVLDGDALIEIIHATGPDHRVVIAGRPDVTERLAAALMVYEEVQCLVTLAGNLLARLSVEQMRALVETGRANPDLLAAVAQRDDLPADLLAAAYAHADEDLRRRLRSTPNGETAARLLAERTAARRLLEAPPVSDLMQALMRGKMEAFAEGMARRIGAPGQAMARVMAAPTPRLVSLAARAADFDRKSAPAIYDEIARRASPPGPRWDDHAARDSAIIFLSMSTEQARAALLKATGHG
jgi:uncharacterized protein (DUF2336 family)